MAVDMSVATQVAYRRTAHDVDGRSEEPVAGHGDLRSPERVLVIVRECGFAARKLLDRRARERVTVPRIRVRPVE
jgi:hypothetical protein